jgi:chromosome segregation ATPase
MSGMTDDELTHRVAKLEHEHAATRWYVGRVDRDLAEIGTTQVEHGRKLDNLTGDVQELKGDMQELKGMHQSTQAEIRSLTQLVGQVLERLPEPPHE